MQPTTLVLLRTSQEAKSSSSFPPECGAIGEVYLILYARLPQKFSAASIQQKDGPVD
jgi:hypothetical protein